MLDEGQVSIKARLQGDVLQATGRISQLEVHHRSDGHPPVLQVQVAVQSMEDSRSPQQHVDPQADPTDPSQVAAGPDTGDDDGSTTNTDPYNSFTSNTDE